MNTILTACSHTNCSKKMWQRLFCKTFCSIGTILCKNNVYYTKYDGIPNNYKNARQKDTSKGEILEQQLWWQLAKDVMEMKKYYKQLTMKTYTKCYNQNQELLCWKIQENVNKWQIYWLHTSLCLILDEHNLISNKFIP